MPFSIPTFLASNFVRNATLHQRKEILKKSYRNQMIIVSTFPFFAMIEQKNFK